MHLIRLFVHHAVQDMQLNINSVNAQFFEKNLIGTVTVVIVAGRTVAVIVKGNFIKWQPK